MALTLAPNLVTFNLNAPQAATLMGYAVPQNNIVALEGALWAQQFNYSGGVRTNLSAALPVSSTLSYHVLPLGSWWEITTNSQGLVLYMLPPVKESNAVQTFTDVTQLPSAVSIGTPTIGFPPSIIQLLYVDLVGFSTEILTSGPAGVAYQGSPILALNTSVNEPAFTVTANAVTSLGHFGVITGATTGSQVTFAFPQPSTSSFVQNAITIPLAPLP